jgi:isopenicillin N synthase-like dioxygenase
MRDELFQNAANLPAIVRENLELFESFVSLCHQALRTILCCMSDALLTMDDTITVVENHHREGEPSTTNITLLHYPPNRSPAQIGQIQHTDIGSLTLLFTEQWGLQVLMPDTKTWAFIQPSERQALVNVGDALRFLSGKRLKSCLHRVIPPKGRYQQESRYSIAYFLRPENEAVFECPDGQWESAKTWHDMKFAMLGERHDVQNASQVATGGMCTDLSFDSPQEIPHDFQPNEV